MGNIIKKIKEKFRNWFGKSGFVETPSLSNQYFNSAVSSFVSSFAGNMVTQRPMTPPSYSTSNWTTFTFKYYTRQSYSISLNLVLDDNGNPKKIEIGKGIGIELKLSSYSIKCPTKDLILYKGDDNKWKISIDDGNNLPGLNYFTRYKFKMLGEDYYWTMVEVINPANEIPNKFRGFRSLKDMETRFLRYEELFNKDWQNDVLWKYQQSSNIMKRK